LNGSWAEPDVRDEVVDYVRYWSDKTNIKATKMIQWIKITRSKYSIGSVVTASSTSTMPGFLVTSV